MAYELAVSDADLAVIDAAVPGNLWRWGFSEAAQVRLLNHSENTTYRVDEEGRCCILRVHRLGYHSQQAIAAELDWVAAIERDTSIRTAMPIAGTDGRLVQPFPSGQGDGRYSVLFEFLDGEEPGEEHDLPESFEQLGSITATLHEHSRGWVRDGRRPARPVWDFERTLGRQPIWGDFRDGIGVTPEVAAHLNQGVARIRSRLQRYGTNPKRFGLVHADLRLANLLVHEGRVGVIDFDDCGYSWFMYDLGSALSFIEHKDYVPALVEAWVRGYEQVQPLADEDVDMLSTFIMLRRILLVGWLGSHSETDLAAEIGAEFAPQTCELVSRYLHRESLLV
ncbi:MAG: phosphotransferase [Acidihalobacter sp.]|uniref:phosphotransferase enzyme family protein n=1 Tax=Acidihalobacter sp. TaxID=1872108 RepID=UPI00307F72F9